MKIRKVLTFQIECPDCHEVHEDTTWRQSRSWLPKHRLQCFLYMLRHNNRKRALSNATCIICGKSRHLMPSTLEVSRKRNALNPEYVGVHRVCRMRFIKPALAHLGKTRQPEDNQN